MKGNHFLLGLFCLIALLAFSTNVSAYYVVDCGLCPNSNDPFHCALSLSVYSQTCRTTADCTRGGFCLYNAGVQGKCGQQLCGNSHRDPDPINGGWSGWGGWGGCSQSCDGGIKYSYRSCNNPTPQYGGANCSGSDTQSTSCNNQACTLNAATIASVTTQSNWQGLNWSGAWAERYGVSTYNIYRNQNGGAFTLLASTASTSYTVTGVTYGVNYGYYVTFTSGGRTATSNTVYALNPSPDSTPPSAPVLMDLNTFSQWVHLTWIAATDAESGIARYNVWYNSNGGSFALLGTSTYNSVPETYYDTNLLSSGPHSFFIEAVNGAGLDANSNRVGTITDYTPPTVPVLAALPLNDDANISLTWTAATDGESGVDHYQVWMSYNNGSAINVADTNNLYYNFPAFGNGYYQFFVTPVNGVGMWINSNIVSTTAWMAAITAPTLAALPAFNDGSFNLDWSANSGSDTTYGILRYVMWSRYNGGAYSVMATTTNVVLSTAGRQTLDGNYCYYVQMFGGSGRDLNSNIVCSYMDSVNPVVGSITNPGATWQLLPFNINFDVNFGISGRGITQYRIDSGAWQNFGADLNIPITTDGNHMVDYNFCDSATNCTSGTIYSALMQNTVTVLSITNPGTTWRNADFNVLFNVSFGTTGRGLAQYRIDSGAWQNFPTTLNALISTDNNHSVDYNFCNVAGFCSSGNLYAALDKTAPVTTDNHNAGWQTADQTITLTATDGNLSGLASTSYGIDGGALTPYTVPFTITTDGNHSVQYYSTDNAGNIEATHTVYVLINKTAPIVVSITNANAWMNVDFNLTFNVNYGAAGYGSAQYSINGGTTWTNLAAASGSNYFVTVNPTLIPLDGNYAVDYNFTNLIGQSVSGTTNILVDRVAAVTTDDHVAGWHMTDQNITLTATDTNGSGVRATYYRVDAGALNNYAGTFTINTDGNHAVQYFSQDNADNNEAVHTVYVAINKTAPIVASISGTGVWHAHDFNLGFIVDYSAAGFGSAQYSTNGGTTWNFLSADGNFYYITITPAIIATDGNHAVDYNFVNALGQPTSGTTNVLIDRSAPSAPVLTDLGASSVTNITLTWTPAVDLQSGIAGYNVFMNSDGSAFTQVGTTVGTDYNYTLSGDANYGFFIEAINGSGLDANSNVTYTIFDSVAPALAITNPGTVWQNADFNVHFDANYGISGFGSAQYNLDGAGWTNFAADLNVLISTDLNHTLDYNFCDAANNCTSGTIYAALDKTAPTLAITNPGTVWQTADFNIAFNVNPSVSGIATALYQIDANGYNAFAPDYNLLIATDGNHSIDYNFCDNANNCTSGTITSARDTVAPITSDNGAAGWHNVDQNVTLTATDGNGSGVANTYYNLDGSGWNTYSGIFAVTTDGNHSIVYYSDDNAGNVETMHTIYLLIDSSVPAVVGITNPGSPWANYDYNVGFTVNYGVSGFGSAQYNLDSNGWTNFPSDLNIFISTDANHRVDYNFCNLAGNCTTGTVYSGHDSTPPTVTVINPGVGWINADYNVSFAVNYALSGFGSAQYDLNGAGWTNFATDYNVFINIDGNTQLDYNFCDIAGNCSSGNTFTAIDRTIPSIVSITNPGQNWANNDYNVGFAVNFGPSGFALAQYRLDSNSWNAFASDMNVLINTDGNHSLDYNFCNVAGNCISGTIYTAHDSTPPVVTVINPGVGWINADYNVDFVVDYTVSGFGSAQYDLNGAGWTNFATDYNVFINIDGNTQLDYNFCDIAGNCSSGNTFTAIDRTVPTVDSITNPGTAWQTSDYNVNFGVTFGPSGRGLAQYRLNSGTWTDFNATLDALITIDGNNTLDYNFCNAAGTCVAGTLSTLHDASAPIAPVLVALPAAVRGTVDLNWTAAPAIDGNSGISHYIVWRDFNGTLTALLSTTDTNFIDNNMPADGAYSYFIQAFNNANLDANSAARATFNDNNAPVIISVLPVADSNISIMTPTIVANYTDAVLIDLNTVRFYVDGILVAPQIIDNNHVSFTPSGNLILGLHDANIVLSDIAGNSTSYLWHFTIDDGVRHNLALTAFNAPTLIDLNGGTALITATVFNDGNATENSTIRFFVGGTQVYSSAISLLIGASQVYSYTWTPSTLGTFTVLASITPVGLEATLADNNASSTLTVDTNSSGPTVDLVISQFNVSNIFPTEGDIVSVTAVVENFSAVAFSGDVNVALYDYSGLVQRQTVTMNLAPLATQNVDFNWNTAGKLGFYSISAMVDDTNDIAEADENNNTAQRNILVAGTTPSTFDFVTTYINAPTSAYDTNFISIRGTVRALGTNVTGIRASLLVDGTITQTLVLNMADGVDQNVDFNWTAATGTHTLAVMIDSLAMFDENSEINNTMSSTITVASGSGGQGAQGYTITTFIGDGKVPVVEEPVVEETTPGSTPEAPPASNTEPTPSGSGPNDQNALLMGVDLVNGGSGAPTGFLGLMTPTNVGVGVVGILVLLGAGFIIVKSGAAAAIFGAKK